MIKGEGNASAVETLVERTSRLVMLVKLPEFKPASAANVLQGFTDKLLGTCLCSIGEHFSCVNWRETPRKLNR